MTDSIKHLADFAKLLNKNEHDPKAIVYSYFMVLKQFVLVLEMWVPFEQMLSICEKKF